MYGSSFCIVTRRPRLLRSRPRDAAASPLPSELATPPVTKMCLATGFQLIPPSRPRRWTAPSEPPAQAVEEAQRRDGVDDAAERHHLGEQVQQGDDDQGAH